MNENDPYQEFYHDDGNFDYDAAEQHFKEQTNKNEKQKRETDNQKEKMNIIHDNVLLMQVDGKKIAKIVKNSKSRLILQTDDGKVLVIEAITDDVTGSASLEISI